MVILKGFEQFEKAAEVTEIDFQVILQLFLTFIS